MVQILIVKPKTLTAADKKILRESGVVCVEAADPSAVRLIGAEGPPMEANAMFRAAMIALAAENGSGTSQCRAKFIEMMALMAKANGFPGAPQ